MYVAISVYYTVFVLKYLLTFDRDLMAKVGGYCDVNGPCIYLGVKIYFSDILLKHRLREIRRFCFIFRFLYLATFEELSLTSIVYILISVVILSIYAKNLFNVPLLGEVFFSIYMGSLASSIKTKTFSINDRVLNSLNYFESWL